MIKKNIYKSKASQIRKELIEKFYLLKEGHPGSVFSILDVLIVLYYGKFVRLKGKKVIDDVIMSKGHATVGQYPILRDLGRDRESGHRTFTQQVIPYTVEI